MTNEIPTLGEEQIRQIVRDELRAAGILPLEALSESMRLFKQRFPRSAQFGAAGEAQGRAAWLAAQEDET